MRLILASQSPRRKQIFTRLNIPFQIINSKIDEDQFHPINGPIIYSRELAEVKASAVSNQYIDMLVLGADTIVVLDDKILGKPADRQDAINMLNFLSGHTHQVITAVSMQCKETQFIHTFHETTDVTFNKLDKQDILNYVNTDSPYDKAGSYGIQDMSAIFVSHIKGCYDNVVGFPLSRFYKEFVKNGFNLNEIS